MKKFKNLENLKSEKFSRKQLADVKGAIKMNKQTYICAHADVSVTTDDGTNYSICY